LTAIRFHCRDTFWAVAALVALSGPAGCRQGVPVVYPSTGAQANGTISGMVSGPEGADPMEGRTVEVVNVGTGERQRVVTGNTGGFSVRVKPGEYRVDLTLRDGEVIIKRPGVIDVNRSDVDAHADFVVGPSHLAHPRYNAPRPADGLGAAIA
jgi:Carboxypeptidase regulatory-like domain